jgi:hypothetical protein
MEAWKSRETRENRRVALIACLLANIHRSEDQEPFEMEDFMPQTKEEAARREAEKQRVSQVKMAAFLAARFERPSSAEMPDSKDRSAEPPVGA